MEEISVGHKLHNVSLGHFPSQTGQSASRRSWRERERIEQENINGGKMEDNERGRRTMGGGRGQ